MKKIILIIIALLLLYGFGYLNKSLSEKAYKSCMDAGRQSEETCYYYAYM